MTQIECTFLSQALYTYATVTVLIPSMGFDKMISGQQFTYDPEEKFKTLYLLHGITGDHKDWLRFTSIERYAEAKNLAVVMPSVGNSFYANMEHGSKYWTFVSEELPRVVRNLFPLSKKREENFVAGLSMGGYGAFKLALNKPECFSAAASLSGALNITDEINFNTPQTIFNLSDIFGSPEKVKQSSDNLFYMLKCLKASETKIPMLYQACGTEDFLYSDNIKFRDDARNLGVDLTYEEGPGEHTWDFWDHYIRKVIDWLPL